MDNKNKKFKYIAIIAVIFVAILGSVIYFNKNKEEEKIIIPTTNIEKDKDSSTQNKSDNQNSKDENDSEDSSNKDNSTPAYEYWLSAAVLTGISMQYPDFEDSEFYIADETDLGDHDSSKGVYVTFSIDGKEKCVYSKPLEKERSKSGTKDVHSEVVGYATFDEVSKSDIKSNFHKVSIDNMNDLIENSVRVLVYEH